MPDNAVYFPYINIPQTPWTVRTLLYWDTVHCIVPEQFFSNPDELQPHMRELVHSGLVRQETPSRYFWDFEGEFQRHLDRLSPTELRRREQSLRAGGWERVHGMKLFYFAGGLVGRGLARREGDSFEWCHIERRTAQEFMTTLAFAVADRNHATPVTDRRSAVRAGRRPNLDDPTRVQLREALLADALPVPAGWISPAELADFKQRHGSLLPDFRRHVETILIDTLTIADSSMRQERLRLVRDGLRDRAAAIAEVLRADRSVGARAQRLVAGTLSVLGAFGPGWLGLLGGLLRRHGPGPHEHHLLYAGYARAEFSDPKSQ